MKQTVIGLFKRPDDARKAVQQLTSSGFTTDNVDMSLSYADGSSDSSDNRNFDLDNNRDYDNDREEHDDQESGISRFFKNLFGDDNDADRYSKAGRNKSIVTVHAVSSDEAHKAADILDDCGAADVDEDANESDYTTNRNYDTNRDYNTSIGAAPVGAFNEGTGTHIYPAPAPDTMLNDTADTSDYDTTDVSDTTGVTNSTGVYADSDVDTDKTTNRDRLSDSDITDKKIPIIEENLEVGKRTVQTGGVRLRSRIVEKPVEEDLRLRTERVYVERNPVDRPATDTDFDNFKEGETEITEHSEVPVVNKEARVVEEVSLGKNVEERTETVRDTVRKTEVDVENLDKDVNSNTKWRDNS